MGEIKKMESGGYLLAWLDHAPTEEIEGMYRRFPEGDYRDAMAIELQRRKLRGWTEIHVATIDNRKKPT